MLKFYEWQKNMINCVLTFLSNLLVFFTKVMDWLPEGKRTKKKQYTYIEEEKLRVEAVDFMKQITDKCYTLSPNYIQREYKVVDNDLRGTYITYGTALKNGVVGIRHTLSSSKKQKYDKTICYGYDLCSSNPEQKIRPRLISPDGFSKVVELTLNKSLRKGDIFKEKYIFEMKDTISYERAYIISGINYQKVKLNSYDVLLKFYVTYPQNVRVYRLEREKYLYLRTLYPVSLEHELYESDCATFTDNVRVEHSFSLIIYVFDRDKEGENENV